MNRELKTLTRVVIAMFLALFVATSLVQVVYADSLRADPRNVRTLYDSYSAQRGSILVDGTPIAYSSPVNDVYRYQRIYADGEMYAPITGYFTLNQGITGIEGALNAELSGSSNSQFLDSLASIITGQPPSGDSVELTIDPAVQLAAWQALQGYRGSIVAYEPATGRILAMVSTPSFDPNVLASHDSAQVIAQYDSLLADAGSPLDNRAIAGALNPPGSTFKLVTASAALENGYQPDFALANPSSYQLPGTSTSISNAGGGQCGPGETVTIADALRMSCNIPYAELGGLLGQDALRSQAEAFGFNTELSIPLTVTASSFPGELDDAQLALSAFGQYEDRVTPLQMAMISATIANGGLQMKPTLVDQILAPDLSVRRQSGPEELGHPITAETSALLTQMMIANVSNGAASNARMDGVSVAGKTGTAENGRDDPYTLWFTGFAPADNPRVAITVLIEDGGGLGQSGSGNTIAAPIARRVLEAVLLR